MIYGPNGQNCAYATLPAAAVAATKGEKNIGHKFEHTAGETQKAFDANN